MNYSSSVLTTWFWLLDASKLNPESAEFVPQAKTNSQRSYRQLDPSRHHARPPDRFRQSSGNKHGQDEFEAPENNISPSSEQPIRGSGRGGRGKGVRQRDERNDARHTEYRSQRERWTKPESDSDSSRMNRRADGNQQEPYNSTFNRSTDEEGQERPPVKANMRGSYRGSRQKTTFKDRDHRSINEPPPREENLENQVAGRDRRPAGAREHPKLEPDQRNHKGWRGGDRRMQPSSWRKGPVPNPGIQGNWREREHVQVREKEWGGAESEGGKEDESNRNRAGTKGKQALQQNSGQRCPERRTGPVKRIEPPKSKETQTGKVVHFRPFSIRSLLHLYRTVRYRHSALPCLPCLCVYRLFNWAADRGDVWVYGLLWGDSGYGPGLELSELFPCVPPELHQEVGSLACVSSWRYEITKLLINLW